MRTCSKSYPNNSNATIPRHQNKRRVPNIVEPEIRTIEEVVPMADRTMEELLQVPMKGYGEVIVISKILAENFEIKTILLQLAQTNKFHGFERDNPHTHISNFKRMTSTLKYKDVPNDAIKLMLFSYSLEGAIEFGGNLLRKNTKEALKIIEDKSKVRYSRCKSNVSRVNTNSRESSTVEKSCVICGGAHAYYDCIAIDINQSSVYAATGRSITRPKGVVEDVFIKVRKFHFPTDFVVVDFEADPWVSLILGRSFLRTSRALIDVYGEAITLRVNDESVTFNLNQTMRYSSTYDDNSVNRIDVIDIACGEYAQDVLDFKYNSKSGNPTLVSNPSLSKETKNEFCKEPIVKSSSPTLTPFGESNFILEEIEDFLKDESIPTGIEDSYYDPDGDVLYLEKLLNDDPSQLPRWPLNK
uniref:Reverse transcriptase domain-containing protein n=1 Tax=Tanacetum cinerariifolium TaxID=118510 RepID=A0A6L2M2M9_TANCI|nr:reverse transcriptase domain-containing protein [Tanacetum cinerariifolium]